MFKENPDLSIPDDDEKIWKYMSVSKFFSIFLNSSLWFSRLDTFDDPYEGLFPNPLIERISKLKYYEGDQKRLINDMTYGRKHLVSSCFHINEGESEAFWRLYGNGVECIAIQSNVTRLKECLSEAEDDICIGMMNYIDFNDSAPPYPLKADNYSFGLLKRKSFEHEKEIRALIWVPISFDQYEGPQGSDQEDKFIPSQTGVAVKIKIDKLIEKIWLSPFSHMWFEEVVEKFVEKYSEIYGFEKIQIEKSKLMDKPSYLESFS